MPNTLADYKLPEANAHDIQICATEGHVWKSLPHIKVADRFVGYVCSRCRLAEAFTDKEQAAYDAGEMEKRA